MKRWALLHTPEDAIPRRLDAASQHLDALAVYAPRNTQRSRAFDLGLWFGWCVGQDRDWTQADATWLSSFTRALQTVPRGQPLFSGAQVLDFGRHARQPGTIRRVLASVKAFYSWAADAELVTLHVAARIQAFRGPRVPLKQSVDRLHEHEVAELLALASRDPTDNWLVRLLYGTGLRVGEAVLLRFEDLHFDADNARIYDCARAMPHLHLSNFAAAQHPRDAALKTGGRIIPADAPLRAAFADYLVNRLKRLGDDDRSPFVFVTVRGRYRGEAWATDAARSRLRRLNSRLNWTEGRLHPHVLRHTFASELAEIGVPLLTRQALLGHRNPNSTSIYTHASATQMQVAVEALSKFREERFASQA